MIDPKQDGKTHINIYSKGSTWLGKFLSNFTKCDLNMPEGTFKSIEGYWYYLTSKEKDPRLHEVHGWEAKLLGKSLTPLSKKNSLPPEEFQAKIKKAIDQKLKWSEYWKEEFTDSKLPFLHYYVYEGKVIDKTDEYRWLINHFEDRRKLLQQRRDNANTVSESA